MSNDFVPFATGGGANVESQSDYLADPNLPIGNQPGIASSAFNNKALRQANFVASQLAQFMANQTGTNVVDNGVTAQFLSQLKAAIQALPPRIEIFTSGSGTWNMAYYFFIASGNATSGATYTNNAVTFTVVSTVAAATLVQMTGNGDPLVSGTLTKTGGSGDSTLTFYAFRKPTLRVRLAGGGSGSAGTAGGSAAGAGGDTTFGSSFLTGSGGAAPSGAQGGAGGAATIVGLTGIKLSGGSGSGVFSTSNNSSGGAGGNNPLGGAGGAGGTQSGGNAGVTNTGAGAGGAGGNASAAGGGGGGAGGYIDVIIPSPASSYAYAVGAAGSAGGSPGGSGANAGSTGGSGIIVVEQNY